MTNDDVARPSSESSGISEQDSKTVNDRGIKDRSASRPGIAWIVTIVFAVLILIPSMLGFVMKFMELISLTQGDADGGFAITPVVNYLFASAGFLFLLLWAAVNGLFNDLEQPKYVMLENEARLDAEHHV